MAVQELGMQKQEHEQLRARHEQLQDALRQQTQVIVKLCSHWCPELHNGLLIRHEFGLPNQSCSGMPHFLRSAYSKGPAS